jgi:hypothetical protein
MAREKKLGWRPVYAIKSCLLWLEQGDCFLAPFSAENPLLDE